MRTRPDPDAPTPEAMAEVTSEAFDALSAGTSFLASLASAAGRELAAGQLVLDLVAIELARGKAGALGDEDHDPEARASHHAAA